MDSFKDVLEAAQMYCKAQMAEPTYNLYIDGLEPISFEDSSHITLSVRNDFICKIVTDRYLGLLKEAFKSVLGFDVDMDTFMAVSFQYPSDMNVKPEDRERLTDVAQAVIGLSEINRRITGKQIITCDLSLIHI